MNTPLRILQLYPKEDYFTGAAIQLRELAVGLTQRGHEVVVATRPSEIWTAKSRELGLIHYPVPMASEVDLHSVRELVRIVKTHRIQVVHAQKGKARTLAMIAGLFTKIPVLVLNRGVSFPLDPFNRLGYTTGRVHAIVAVCESIKRGLVAQGVRADKVEVIYSGTDTTRFHPGVDGRRIREELGLAPEHFLITQIGVRSWKGNGDVIDAMPTVVAKAPHVRLLIVGARRPEGLYERAEQRGVRAAVHVLGYREDIPEILRGSDCCIDASYAGLGLTGTLREALAVGTPAIGTDLEGNPEIVIDGENGFLVKPRDVAGIVAAMLAIAADRERARAMGMAGRALVERKFSTLVKIERTEALYERLVAARGA